MSPDQRQVRERAGFSTSYAPEPGEIIAQEFRTREANDEYASGLELMGVENIVKSYYDPLIRQWLQYTDKIFYAENL